MHVLVVEDEQKIRDFLVNGLKAEGHTTLGAASFQSAKETIEQDSEQLIDFVLLDRMLEDQDGCELIPLLKKTHPKCAILILSAVGSAEEKADLLDKGADDYVSKPFSFVELSARIRVLSRRNPVGEVRKHLVFRDCKVDLVEHSVAISGKKLELSQKEYQLLLIFLKQPGRVYNRFQLLDQIWNSQYEVESNVVEVTINNLRRKLESSKSEVIIASKRNIGYWIEA